MLSVGFSPFVFQVPSLIARVNNRLIDDILCVISTQGPSSHENLGWMTELMAHRNILWEQFFDENKVL